jgi:Fanconi anemia group I protein
MFRDVPLTNEELKFVIEKVLRMFRELDMGDIPALVYQLLLLATKVIQ